MMDGRDLFEALNELRAANTDLIADIGQIQLKVGARFPALIEAIEGLGDEKPAKPLMMTKEAEDEWASFCNGQTSELSARTIRHLCWAVNVATDQQFYTYLASRRTPLKSKSLQGLVRLLHHNWSDELICSDGARWLRAQVGEYPGPNKILTKWKANSELVLGKNGPSEFGLELIRDKAGVDAKISQYGLDEDSLFTLLALVEACRTARDRLDTDESVRTYFVSVLLKWAKWPVEILKEEIDKAILHTIADRDARYREALRRLVVADWAECLGDPRLPANSSNWLAVSEEAKDRIRQWISSFDIEFFFNHVLPTHADPHGRKKFWLRYVPRIRASRSLLCESDLAKVWKLLKESKGGGFGRLSENLTSAFVLDFGPVIVVEFSRVGNACYVYPREFAETYNLKMWDEQERSPDSWKKKYQLKLRRLGDHRIVHSTSWQDDVRNVLAKYGIRP